MAVLGHQARTTKLAGYATARALAEQVAIVRTVYAHELQGEAVRDMPLPVTLVKRIGVAVERRLPGSQIRIFSDEPFEGTEYQLDDFQRRALARLRSAPESAVFEIAQQGDAEVVRYAVADRMSETCVQCHNTHPASPRRDWKVGDVRGAIEVVVPVDELSQQLGYENKTLIALLISGFAALVVIVALTLRQHFLQLEREHAAQRDWLTGFLSRQAGRESFEREIRRAQRYGTPLSVMLIDIDHFKRVNDIHGHAAGDRVLRALGAVLLADLRTTDVPIRWGGEELVLLLPHTVLAEAAALAERLRFVVEHDVAIAPRITISGGVAEWRRGETVEEVVERADKELYEAKASGRNRVCIARDNRPTIEE
jgi:diguanylate cyclase (GGDEF)-like protein